MIIKLKKKSIHECLYCITLALYIFGTHMNSSLFSIDLMNSAIKWFCTGMLCLDFISLYFKKVSLKRFILMIGIIISCAFAAITTNRTYLILTALFIICADKIEFGEIVKTSMIASGFTIGLIVLCSLVGIIPNYTFYRGNGTTALCLGFSYYSTVPYTICFIILMYMYLRDYRIKWIEIIVLFMCNYLLYKVTSVRLTYGITLLAFILEIFLIKFKSLSLDNKLIKNISIIAFPIAFFSVIVFTYLYTKGEPDWIYNLNEWLSGRLALNAKASSMYSITLFGQYVEMEGNSAVRAVQNYFYIDSGFFYSLIGYGILFTVVFLLIYSYLYQYSVKNNDKPLFIWLTCVLIFTLVNNVWVTIATNPVLLAFGCYMQFIRSKDAKTAEPNCAFSATLIKYN